MKKVFGLTLATLLVALGGAAAHGFFEGGALLLKAGDGLGRAFCRLAVEGGDDVDRYRPNEDVDGDGGGPGHSQFRRHCKRVDDDDDHVDNSRHTAGNGHRPGVLEVEEVIGHDHGHDEREHAEAHNIALEDGRQE